MIMVKVNKHFWCEGSKLNQILCAVLINLPVLCYGACVGWMSPMTPLLQSAANPHGAALTDDQVSWLAAATYITAVPAVFVFGFLVDQYGRKASLLLTSVQFAACWTIKLCSTAHWAMVLARGLVGTGLAGCYVVAPLYTKEVSQDSVRGAMGSLVILSQTLGNLLLFVVGDVLSYRAVLWLCLALPATHVLLFLRMPESPSFLLRQGDKNKTLQALAWLRCREETDPVVQNEMNLLRLELEQERGNTSFALKRIVTDRTLFRAFRITMVLSVAREVCGTVPVIHFASDILSAAQGGPGAAGVAGAAGTAGAAGVAGAALSSNQQAMLLGAVQVAGAAFASSLVERAGRKPLLFVTSLVSGLGMCALAGWLKCRAAPATASATAAAWSSATEWLPVAALCVCIFCDASGLQPVSLVVMSEMFAFQYRSTVTSVAMSTVCFFNFLQLRFFKPMAAALGYHGAFFLFGGVCLANALYIALAVPETRMRSVADIYSELGDKEESYSLLGEKGDGYRSRHEGKGDAYCSLREGKRDGESPEELLC